MPNAMPRDLSRSLIYGAYGYTGELIARLAASRNERPILAGRDGSRVEKLAQELGLPWRVFGLSSAEDVEHGLRDVDVVLHCAGPFSRTAAPMVDACIATGTHYIDITGEIAVFEACARQSERAANANVLLLPGAGFDVVPSDCLALHLSQRLPNAKSLVMGFHMVGGGVSHGTATTMVEGLGLPNFVRRGGDIVPVRAGKLRRSFDFGDKERVALAIPWGDVSTAFYTTGIPDIATYFTFPTSGLIGLWMAGFAGPILRSGFVHNAAQRKIDAAPAGPDAACRHRAHATIVGEVTGDDGATVTVRQHVPDGYELTMQTALEILGRVSVAPPTTGFATPAQCFGPDLILEFPGVSREDDL